MSDPESLPSPRPRMLRWLRGSPGRPWWARGGLLALTAVSAVLVTWSLDASGYGNEYYAAAAYSGSLDWNAWLFGSLDTGSFISVDKPPFSLWVTGLSIRVFGLSSWSVLLPHALAGVATVLVLHATVRRWHGDAAALGAGALLAITPVFVVMSRYNNPDAILTLVITGSLALAYSATRSGSVRLLAGSGALAGLAFLTKTTQGLLVLPAIAVTYLIAAPAAPLKRLAHGAVAAAAWLVTAGWWVLLAVTVPSAPFFGQTESGSFLEYVFGYNGLGRVTGDGVGPGDPFGGGGGWSRLFNLEVGGQVSWLIPLAAAGLLAGLWFARRDVRTDPIRAGWVLWGTFFVTQVITFSLMQGVFHPYYVLTLAPPVAALAGAGAADLWRRSADSAAPAWLLGALTAGTAAWAAVVLGRTPDFAPGLTGLVVVLGGVSAVAIPLARAGGPPRWVTAGVAAAAIVAVTAGPAAYAFASIGTDYSGGDPKAGPGETGQPVPAASPATGPSIPADRPSRPPAGDQPIAELPPAGDRPELTPSAADARPPNDGGAPGGPSGSGVEAGAGRAGLAEFLVEHHDGEAWIAATAGSRLAAPLILSTGEAVMAMGGFSGGDPVPTADDLRGYLEDGSVRFLVLSRDGRTGQDWARVGEASCAVVDATEYGGGGGLVVYDCA